LLSILGSSGRQRRKLDLPSVLLTNNLHCERIRKLMQLKLPVAPWLTDDEPGLSGNISMFGMLGLRVEGDLAVRKLLLLR